MTQPKVSIIVPIYNAGIHLEKCLYSLVNQTLREIEIILILDCPTDGSDTVAENFGKKDSRIIIIKNEKNLHVGLSRNKGLSTSSGEYIGFIDHDDFCEPTMFETLYEKAIKEKTDIAICNFFTHDEKGAVEHKCPQKLTNDQLLSQLLPNMLTWRTKESLPGMGLIWNQIYKRRLIIDNHIEFPDNKKITFEDRFFLIQVYFYAKRLSQINQGLYHHIIYSNSTGASYAYLSVKLTVPYLEAVYDFLYKNKAQKKYGLIFSKGVCLFLYSVFRHEIRHTSIKEAFDKLLILRNGNMLHKSLKQLFYPKNFKTLIKLRITKIFFVLIVLLFYRPKK